MQNFEAGKKVIAIRDHPEMAYRSGEVYRLNSIRDTMCKCSNPLLDIGLHNDYRYWVCDVCYDSGRVEDGIFWAASVDFAPYDDSLSDVTYEEVIQQITARTIKPLLLCRD